MVEKFSNKGIDVTTFSRTTEPLQEDGEKAIEGFIKLRLGHSEVGTIIIPDFVFINEGRKVKYFSPSFFSACSIGFNVDDGLHKATLSVDFASPNQIEGTRAQIEIQSIDRILSYDDGAQLYKCSIRCDDKILNFSAGEAIKEGEHFSIALFVIVQTLSDSYRFLS